MNSVLAEFWKKTDSASVLGIVIALVCIIGGQLLEGGRIGSMIQFAAFLIVLGGTVGAVMVQSQLSVFVRAIRMVPWAFSPPHSDAQSMLMEVVDWAAIARKDGILALERLI